MLEARGGQHARFIEPNGKTTLAMSIAEKSGRKSPSSSDRELQFILKAGRLGTWTLDLATGSLTTSKSCRANFGRDPEQVFTYAQLRDAVHPEDKERMARAVETSIATGADYDIEYRAITPAGEVRWVQIRAQPFYSADGAAERMAGVSIDVTARRNAEAALRESERRYRAIFDGIDEGFCIVEFLDTESGPLSDYVYIDANRAYARHVGMANVIGQRARQSIPNEAEEWIELLRPVVLSGEPVRFERELTATRRYLEVSAFRIEPASRRQLAVVCQDITARKRAENELRAMNESLEQRVEERSSALRLYRDIVQSNAAPVVAFDHDHRVVAFNPAYAEFFDRFYGQEARLGEVATARLTFDEATRVRTWMARALTGEIFTVQQSSGKPGDESSLWEISYNPLRDDDGRILGGFHHAVDITVQHNAEIDLETAREQLNQSQKMEAMGQLTGGVAHDFNNLLVPIVGTLDLLGRKRLGGEREQRLIAAAAQSAERARTLVQRLLAFARRQPLQPVAVDLTALVRGMGDLVASTSGPQIKVTIDAPGHLPHAHADPNQLEMALLNLAVNARDAMSDGGVLRISASAHAVKVDEVPGLAEGQYLRLSVADSGTGMDEATLARAVEPFFSTKGVGQGTGLGLSMAHGLALQLNGALKIHSALGLGTNVELWLPQFEGAANAAPELPNSVDNTPMSGRALVIDDEPLVRMSTADMLTDLGYSVEEASSAEEALRMMSSKKFDYVVTDHLMPGMTGSDLAHIASSLYPDMRILLVSGYAAVEGVAADLPRLNKPFKKDDLALMMSSL